MARFNILLLAVLVVCALSVVSSQNRARRTYAELEKQQDVAQQLAVEWGQLQLEQSTWATHARIDRIASASLRMGTPPSSRVQVIAPEHAQ
jgi:cell division protein FtsL